ncbi:MAG TPA: spore germination protein GerW family protein [Armatimonadota bacterium]|jgi:uncharacterized spore protein YtfJ
MADFDAGTVLAQVSNGLTKFAESVKVIGDPVEAAGKVIIPAIVARVAFGAGGGSGTAAEGTTEGVKEGHAMGGAGGGGGGITLSPVFLIVDAEGERLLTVPDAASAVTHVVDKIKAAVQAVTKSREE